MAECKVIGRLQYGYLFAPRNPHPNNTNPSAKPRYAATPLLEADQAGVLYQVIQQVSAEKFGEGVVVPSSLRSGAEKADKPDAGFRPDMWFCNTSSADAPFLCNNERRIGYQGDVFIGQQDPLANLFYSGAKCMFLLDVWAQVPKPGEAREKRINVELKGVQFLEHGEVLAGGSTKPVTGADFGLPSMPGVDPSAGPAAAPAPQAAPMQQMPTAAPAPAPMPAPAPAPAPAPMPGGGMPPPPPPPAR